MQPEPTSTKYVPLFSTERKVSLFESEEKVSLFMNEDKIDITLPTVKGYVSSAFNTFSRPLRFFASIIYNAVFRVKVRKSSPTRDIPPKN